MMTLTEAMTYLGYETTDQTDQVVVANVNRILRSATATLLGAVGSDLETYLPDDPRATELVCMYMDDLHNNTGVSAKVSGATRHLTQTMELQLSTELARLREEADA